MKCRALKSRHMTYSGGRSRDVAEAQAPSLASVRARKYPAMVTTSAAPHRRALIVNGDPVTARLCRETLEQLGFVIEGANSGVTAVVAAREQMPDLIVMDFQLSDVSAVETIAWLRANPSLKSIPIVVLGIADRARLSARDVTAMTALGKPVTSAAIERAVRELCR